MRFLLVLAAFYSFSAQAMVFQFTNSDGQQIQANFYVEDNRAVVEEIQRGADGWPELKQRHYFKTDLEARIFIRDNFVGAKIIQQVDEGSAPQLLGLASHLWPVTQEWNWEWEKKFAAWVKAEVHEDFFFKHNIATDCADVAYAARWIFARIHGLPMASRLTTGEWMSQKSVRASWGKLPTSKEWNKDKKFMAALDYLLDQTYTHTLLKDMYPILIKPEAFLEGTIAIYTHTSSGHTRLINQVELTGAEPLPVHLVQSTVPRAVRKLMGDGLWDNSKFEKGKGGIMRFRWPTSAEKGLMDGKKMPFYSEEQYEKEFMPEGESFFVAVFKRLIPGFDLKATAMQAVQSVKDLFINRIAIVQDGYAYCQQQDCTPGGAGYEAWSTPSRDGAIKDRLLIMRQIVRLVDEQAREKIQAMLDEPFFEIDGQRFSLMALEWVWNYQFYSFDPRVSPNIRWAVSPQGLYAGITQKGRELWAQREEILKKYPVACDADLCTDPKSPEWMKRDTNMMDQALNLLSFVGDIYCQGNFPKGTCEEFGRLLKERNGIVPEDGRSLEALLKSFVFLSSDPRQSLDIRRGAMEKKLKAIVVQGTPISSENNFLYLANNSVLTEGILYDVKSEPVKILPPIGRWIFFDQQHKMGWYINEKILSVKEMESGKVREISIPFIPQEINRIGENKILLMAAGLWAILAWDETSLKILNSGSGDSFRKLDASHMLRKQGDVFSVLDLEKDGQEFLIKSEFDLMKGYPAFSTDLGWFYNTADSTGNMSITLLIRKSDFVVQKVIDDFYPTFVDQSGKRMLGVNWGKMKGALFELGNDGKVIAEKKYKLMGSNSNTVSLEDERGPLSFYMANGILSLIRPMPGEKMITSVKDDLVIAKKDKTTVIRRIDNATPLLETKSLASFSTLAEYGKSLATLCDGNQVGDRWLEQCRVEDFSKSLSLLSGGYMGSDLFRLPDLKQGLYINYYFGNGGNGSQSINYWFDRR